MQRAGRLRLAVVAPLAAGIAALVVGLLSYAVAGSALISVVLAASAAAVAAAFALRPLGALLAPSAPGPERASGRVAPFSETEAFEWAVSSGRSASAALERVSREKSNLEAALDGSADAVVAVDGDGNVCYLNAAARRLFAGGPEDVLGRPLAWLLPNADVVEALEEVRKRGLRVLRTVEAPGRQVLQLSAAPQPEGGSWAAVAVFHDVTEERRAEQMRRDFVANVSHELRTPLASIKAVLETLEGGAISDAAAAQDFIARAETEVERLTNMMTDLLELSRIESGAAAAPQPVDAGHAVSEAVERQRSQAIRGEISLTCEIEPGLPAVAADGDRLERAVINLIQNAIKFTSPGGHVDVRVAGRDGSVAIEVADDGPGIEARDLPRIFERFYKADNSRQTVGSGLGLALVKHTAEAFGGQVTVESEPGKGSKFTILLPVAGRIAPKALTEARPVP